MPINFDFQQEAMIFSLLFPLWAQTQNNVVHGGQHT